MSGAWLRDSLRVQPLLQGITITTKPHSWKRPLHMAVLRATGGIGRCPVPRLRLARTFFDLSGVKAVSEIRRLL